MVVLSISTVVSAITSLSYSLPNTLQGIANAALVAYTAVQQTEENQQSWTCLANRSHGILITLSQAQTQTPAFAHQARRLVQFHDQIYQYYTHEVQVLHKVQRVFMSNKIRQRIEQLCRDLDVLWQGVMLALAIDTNDMLNEADLRRAIQQDENQNEVFVAQINSLLRQNNTAVLDQMDIRLNQQEWKIRQATNALQQLLQNGDGIQQVVDRAATLLLGMLQDQSKVARSLQHKPWRIPTSSITNRSPEPIACGGFGEVYTATYYGSKVAVKQLLCSYRETEIAEFRREIEVWHMLNHSNILPLRGACDTAERPFMVSPFMENGTLKRYISDPWCPRSLEDRLRLMYEVACGMAYLHGNHVVHGDLKTDNVLLDSGYHAVISDFGLSRTKHTSAASIVRPGQSIGGTLGYMAPEMLDDDNPRGSSNTTDIYAFGIMLYEVLKNGDYIWVSIDGKPLTQCTVERLVCSGRRPKRFEGIPDNIWSLIETCWHQDPTARPTFQNIVSDLGPYANGENVSPQPEKPDQQPEGSTAVAPSSHSGGSSVQPDSTPPHPLGMSRQTSTVSLAIDSNPLLHTLKVDYNIPQATIIRIYFGEVAVQLATARQLSEGKPVKPANDPVWATVAGLYQGLADGKNLEAAFELAWLHLTGIGVTKSDREAFAYWELVHDFSADPVMKPIATFMMGWCCYLGRGTRQDNTRATQLLRESDTPEFGFGEESIQGRETASSSATAAMFFQRCQFGSERDWLCRHLVARCLIGGFGTTLDPEYAVGILHELASQEYSISQSVLGDCYQRGYGVPRNSIMAAQWHQRSTESGDASAIHGMETDTINGDGLIGTRA